MHAPAGGVWHGDAAGAGGAPPGGAGHRVRLLLRRGPSRHAGAGTPLLSALPCSLLCLPTLPARSHDAHCLPLSFSHRLPSHRPPASLLQIGVDNSDAALLMACAEKATIPGESLHREPFKVTPLGLGSGRALGRVLWSRLQRRCEGMPAAGSAREGRRAAPHTDRPTPRPSPMPPPPARSPRSCCGTPCWQRTPWGSSTWQPTAAPPPRRLQTARADQCARSGSSRTGGVISGGSVPRCCHATAPSVSPFSCPPCAGAHSYYTLPPPPSPQAAVVFCIPSPQPPSCLLASVSASSAAVKRMQTRNTLPAACLPPLLAGTSACSSRDSLHRVLYSKLQAGWLRQNGAWSMHC